MADDGTREAQGPPATPGNREAASGIPAVPWPEVRQPAELGHALDLVEFLRAHCPWDAEQTPSSLLPHLLEEAHEVADAVRERPRGELAGELGDLLLNVAFQVVLAEEEGRFTRDDVVRALDRKMRRRHPHLSGEGAREAWEVLKTRERGGAAGVLAGLAPGLDPLLRAHRMQERASAVGFDWDDARGAFEKVAEELAEVGEALEKGSPREVQEEVGDLLFAAVNLARLAGAHAATALDAANRKFRGRFERLEVLARERGVRLGEAPLEALDALWDELKARDAADAEDGGSGADSPSRPGRDRDPSPQ